MENVTLRQLEAFLAVAEELHFGRAAERLSVSAPWMSHTVRDLERALRVELLTRTTRTVQVTPRAGCSPVSRARSSPSSRPRSRQCAA